MSKYLANKLQDVMPNLVSESTYVNNRFTSECRRLVSEKLVKMALCGMEYVNLNNYVIKILRVCYSYNKKLENEKNTLNRITKLQNVLNMWRMKNLSLLGKISIFKALDFSEIIHLTLVTSVTSTTIDLLQ